MRRPSSGGAGGACGMYPWIDRGASPTSSWYRTSTVSTSNIATFGTFAETIYASYFSSPVTCTLTELGVYVNTGVAGSAARLGVYDTGGWGSPYPVNLLLDAGTVPTTPGAMAQFIVGLTLPIIMDTLYAAVFLTDTNTPGFSCSVAYSCWTTWGSSNTLDSGRSCIRHAQAWGALPAVFPSAAPTATSNPANPHPTMYVRFG